MTYIKKYSNKEVPFRFNGVDLSFFLSLSLFSSYSIDNGTKLLLKTIAKGIDFSDIKTVIDIGCGVGVIGLSLKKRYPDLKMVLQDRDALALEFSRANAIRNKIKEISFSGGLALEGIKEGSQNLIISNLPAKAGEPVLHDFVKRCLLYLSPNGICAIVVVATLKETILTAIANSNIDVFYTEDTREYSVFHFGNSGNADIEAEETSRSNLRECYIRGTNSFQIKKLHYSLKSVYNLPGFDTIPYPIEIAAHILGKQPLSGRTLFWNPGQGHLPVIAHLANRNKIIETILASEDILQLKISRENLFDIFGDDHKETLTLKHICCPEELCTDAIHRVSSSTTHIPTADTGYNSIVISLTESDNTILENLLPITFPEGILVLTGKSAHIAGTIKTHKGWIQLASRKYRGFRAVIFKKA